MNDLVKSLIWLRVLFYYLSFTVYSFNELMFALMKELPGLSFQDLHDMKIDELMWFFQRLEKHLKDQQNANKSKGMSIS